MGGFPCDHATRSRWSGPRTDRNDGKVEVGVVTGEGDGRRPGANQRARSPEGGRQASEEAERAREGGRGDGRGRKRTRRVLFIILRTEQCSASVHGGGRAGVDHPVPLRYVWEICYFTEAGGGRPDQRNGVKCAPELLTVQDRGPLSFSAWAARGPSHRKRVVLWFVPAVAGTGSQGRGSTGDSGCTLT